MRPRRKFGGFLAYGLLLAVFGCNGSSQPSKQDDKSANTPVATNNDTGGAVRRLIMLTNGEDPFWDAMRAGMMAANKELKLADVGLRAELDKNDGTPKGQIDKLKQYANQTDIAAVAISVIDPRSVAIAEAMRGLRSQGIRVITIDSDVDREKAGDTRFAYLGTDNLVGGRELGRAAKALRPEGGKYAAFVGVKSAATAQERTGGFAEAAGPKFEQAEYLGDNWDRGVAKKNVGDALNRHDDINVLVGIWGYNAHGICQTVKERNLRDKIACVTFDAAELAISDMEEGLLDAMVVQNPYEMGFQGTKLMKALVEEDHATVGQMYPAYEQDEHVITKPGGDIRLTGLKVVVPDNEQRITKELFEPTTEFMRLSEFKKWLAERKLRGS